MKKLSLLLASIATLFLIANMATSADIAQVDAGDPVTIAVNTAVVAGATNVQFDPSAQVLMHGNSVREAFMAVSGHTSVQGKEAGQNYGMASDSSKVWWESAETDQITNTSTFTATNSAGFTGNWLKN